MLASIRNLLLSSLVLLASFIMVASSVDRGRTKAIDTQVVHWFQQFRHPLLNKIMLFFSFIGDTIPVTVISILVMFILYRFFHQRIELFLFSFVLIGSTSSTILLKSYYQRERPQLEMLVMEEGFSFPSGHSMAALSLYGIVTFLLWRHVLNLSGRKILLLCSIIFILIIGVSRMYLGVHYPSDVVGAYLFSGFWLMFSIAIFQYVKVRRDRRNRQIV